MAACRYRPKHYSEQSLPSLKQLLAQVFSIGTARIDSVVLLTVAARGGIAIALQQI